MKYFTHHCRLRWHGEGSSPLACRMLLLLCCVLLFSAAAYGENTPANHVPGPVVQRGAKLWSLPIGGHLTLSRDGKTLLVASLADSNFYVVDVETGTIRRKLTPKYNRSAPTRYWGSSDIEWLAVKASVHDSLNAVWDTEADTIVSRLYGALYYCVSKKLNRFVARSAPISSAPILLDASTLRVVKEFSLANDKSGSIYWFDDDRGLLYRSYGGTLEVYDAITGEQLPGYGIWGSRQGVVRSPAAGDWIYYLSTNKELYHGDPLNSYFVKAFKPDDHSTSNGVIFNWDSLKMQGTTLFDSGGWTVGTTGQSFNLFLYNCVWQFDANALQYRIMFEAPRDTFPGDNDARNYKSFVITPGFDKYINCFNTANPAATVTCYALEPAATAVQGETPSDTSWLTVSGESLRVAYGSRVDVVTLTASDGRMVSTLGGPWDQAFTLPIGGLASGVYLCTIGTSSGQHSTSFTITR